MVTQASTEIAKLSMLEKAPLWAKNSLDLFQFDSPLPEFVALLQKWIDFEQTKKWASKGKFGAITRPQAVHDWISHARPKTFQLQAVVSGVNTVEEFQTKFWAWWSVLQPEFRQRADDEDTMLARDEDGRPDRRREGDWGVMDIHGLNGWVSIMATLCFWSWVIKGMKKVGYCQEVVAQRVLWDWLMAVEDTDFVLSCTMTT